MIILYLLLLILFLFLLWPRGSINDFRVIEYPYFLSHAECDEIIEIASDKLVESRVHTIDQKIDNTHRVSKQCWLSNTDCNIADKISNEVSDMTRCKKDCQEMLQVVKYDEGGFF